MVGHQFDRSGNGVAFEDSIPIAALQMGVHPR